MYNTCTFRTCIPRLTVTRCHWYAWMLRGTVRVRSTQGAHSRSGNVEPQEIPKHGLLMNVSGIREGERKRMKRERLRGRRGGDDGGIPERKSSQD